MSLIVIPSAAARARTASTRLGGSLHVTAVIAVLQISRCFGDGGMSAASGGTGEIGDRGEHDQIVNAPLRAGDGSEAFREAMKVAILPRIEDFAPDLIVISAGFDAHRLDPLGNLNLVEADFAWVTRSVVEIAQRRCGGRIVSVLEGGYDLDALARSAAAHVLALMEG